MSFVTVCICAFLWSPSNASESPPLKIGAPLDFLRTTELHDSFNEIHNGHRHDAIDIMRPRGTPVRAVADGVIRKVFISRQGGLTIYEFDRESAYCFYYAHLDHYADKLREGRAVARGDVIGYVGTGDASPDAPQVHFAIFKLGPDKSWWKGKAIDPYPILLRAASSASARSDGEGRFAISKPEPASLARSCPRSFLPLAMLASSGWQASVRSVGGHTAAKLFPGRSARRDSPRAAVRA